MSSPDDKSFFSAPHSGIQQSKCVTSKRYLLLSLLLYSITSNAMAIVQLDDTAPVIDLYSGSNQKMEAFKAYFHLLGKPLYNSLRAHMRALLTAVYVLGISLDCLFAFGILKQSLCLVALYTAQMLISAVISLGFVQSYAEELMPTIPLLTVIAILEASIAAWYLCDLRKMQDGIQAL